MPAPDPATSPTTTTSGAHRSAETVVFALQPPFTYRFNKGYMAAMKPAGRVRFMAFGFGIMLVISVCHFVGCSFDPWFVVMGLLVLGLPFVFRRIISNRRFKRTYKSRLPLKPSEDCRLCCVGTPEDLADYGDWADVPFEPAMFFGKFSIRGHGWPRWLYPSTVILVLVAWLGFGMLGLLGPNFQRLAFFAFMSALGIAELVTAFLWPTYLRLVPGRFDVLGYGPLSKKPIFLDRYDLRDATITADLRRSFVSIVSKHGEPPRRLEFGISLMSERRKFVYMLFLAAMSSYKPGRVPEDGLLA
jgi:hypothetical protein